MCRAKEFIFFSAKNKQGKINRYPKNSVTCQSSLPLDIVGYTEADFPSNRWFISRPDGEGSFYELAALIVQD